MNFKQLACAGIAFFALAGCATSQDDSQKIGFSDLPSYRVSGVDAVYTRRDSYSDQVSILVNVEVNGKVKSAKALRDRFSEDSRTALAAVKDWRFQPLTFEGKPVRAVGEVAIDLRPHEILPDVSVPFPSAAPMDIAITLKRSACYGDCPDYSVTVTGEGKIRFSTNEVNFPGGEAEVHRLFNGHSVLLLGTDDAEVSPLAVADLLDKFREAHFMGMKPEYVAEITDNPTYVLTLRVGNVIKQVVDYVGSEVGMPASVTALQDAVDHLAGTDRWIYGNAETIALLKARGFDFKSLDATELIQVAASLTNDRSGLSGFNEFIHAALAEGLDLSASVDKGFFGLPEEFVTVGVFLAYYAAINGNEDLFEEMSRAGQVTRMSQEILNRAFVSDMGCSVRIAKALVEAGANPKATGANGNALHTLKWEFKSCAQSGSLKRAEMAATLVALGVPLEARDELGWTPLMGTYDPVVAQILLRAGADPNAKDGDGSPVVFTMDDDRVVLTVLRGGADPKAKGGKFTLRAEARRHHWPATLAWLKANGG